MPVTFNTPGMTRRIRQAVMRAVVRTTEEVREEAISLILDTPKTGRMYRRRGVEHQASAPGEPPASDTGRLVNSIETRYDVSELAGAVVVTVDHGLYLEYGTQTMEPRPFLRPAAANKQDVLVRYVDEEIKKVLR